MDTVKTFPYSAAARRSGYVSTMIAFIALCVIEGGLELLVVTVLVPEGWIKVLINVVHTSLMVLAIGTFVRALMMLKTVHSLTNTDLKLHFGPGFKANLPLTTISRAEAVREKLPSSFIIGATHNRDKKRIYAALSEKGLVLLKLDQLYPFRLGLFKRRQASEILINLDQPDEFLRALEQATKASSNASLVGKKQAD